MAYVSYDENGDPIYPQYENPYLQAAAAPPPIAPAASTAPPLYPGQPGSTYTNFEGQQGTVPTPASGPNGPISTVNQPMWQALWTQSGKNPQVFVQAVISQLGLHGRQTDPTALNTVLRALQSVGVNATLDQRNDQYHKGIMLDGQFVRLIDGSDNWTWQPGGGSGGAGDSAVAPFTEPFTTSAQLVNFNKAPAFDYPDFQAPTGESILKDPSFQFRLDEGRKALEGSKAAKGTLRTGGTLRDVLSLGQNLASTEYGNIFDRSIASYNTNRGNARDRYAVNYGSQTLDPYNFDAANEKERYTRDWNEYLQRYKISGENKDRAFDMQYKTATLGQNAAMA